MDTVDKEARSIPGMNVTIEVIVGERRRIGYGRDQWLRCICGSIEKITARYICIVDNEAILINFG